MYFLRREPFGGVLYHTETGTLKFINHTGYEICFGISRKWSDDDIVGYIGERFNVEAPEAVIRDIRSVRDDLDHPDRWNRAHGVAIGVTHGCVPTLSAPLEIHWEVTGKCNLRCMHCYNESSAAGRQPSLDEIRSVVEEVREAGVKVRGIIVSGGEPLMHSDLRTILELIRPLAAEVVLATNGTLVTAANIDWIAGAVDLVNVSVDAADSTDFARFRGRPDVLERVVAALRLFRDRGVPVVAQTTVSRRNIDALDDLAVLLKRNGVASWVVRMPLPIGRARENTTVFLDDGEAIAREPLFQAIRDRHRADFDTMHIGNRFMWSHSEPFEDTGPRNGLATCAAGTMLATIRSDGTMVPCAIFGDTEVPTAHSGMIWNGHFLSEWRDAGCFRAMRGIALAGIDPCNRCSKLSVLCDGGCRALAFDAFGDVSAPDPSCAYVAAARRRRAAS
ncbi:radical SAM protein [Rhodoplanes sp. TEM]|uniref:Radical SAM protein n=1 Tax=Rhodoplanes tepidamans TaxID=200616 RepID=A0ABT5J4F5_RHOTP|nr:MULTISPECIES: radical SAM protein [Rhodoplanes]MDC7784515.1 radical SAM protein [Rhodoplanes tepidamans]MDC7984422.1 radical SAM protein [Rhodoplanes sp. TEM]MDQ0355743.1 radical SAM protein with 4Fe4S-binding SPASM domain [Rhodoplanes tepidamans]